MYTYLTINKKNNKEYYFKEDTSIFQQREVKPFNKNLVFLGLIPIPFIESTKEKYVSGNIYIYIAISILIGLLIGLVLTSIYKKKIKLKDVELSNDEIVNLIIQSEAKFKDQIKIILGYSIFVLLVLFISIVDKSIFSLIAISLLVVIEIYLLKYFDVFKRRKLFNLLKSKYITDK